MGIEVCDGYSYGECVRPCQNRCGEGYERCVDETWTECDAPTPALTGTIRDFSASHPDFQFPFPAGVERGILAASLNDQGRPVYLGGSGTRTTTGAENFATWFEDVPGVNRSSPITLPLENIGSDNQRVGLEQTEFFPIDGQLGGNEGRPHNYHFTLEASQELTYAGGELLSFAADDDLWVFINDRLAVDLGGTHSASDVVTIDLDGLAAWLGLEVGGTYPIVFFFAERHTTSSALVFDVPEHMLACPG